MFSLWNLNPDWTLEGNKAGTDWFWTHEEIFSIGAACPDTHPALAAALADCSAFGSILSFPTAFQ